MGPDGKTPHSWRVAILPYLDQKKLYDEYKLNEPWDSPANKKVLAKMPPVYGDPNMAANSTNAAYFVPWDSPANKKVLLAKMPPVYGDPNMAANSTNAAYFVLTGKLTAFGKKEGTRFRDIRDGTSNTLLVVESKQDVPWTRPVDLPFDPEKEMPKLGGFYKGGFNAALCDGSVRFLPEGIDEDDLKALITIDGREIINWDLILK